MQSATVKPITESRQGLNTREGLGIRDTSQQDQAVDRQPDRKRTLLFAGAATAAVVILAFLYPSYQRWASAEQTVSRASLRFATVARGDLVRDISAQGKVVAAVKPTLFSPASGNVSLLVQAGDQVISGQPVAEIDSPEILNRFAQEKSGMESAQTQYQRQQIQAKKLQLQNQQTVDLAMVSLTAARRELRRAEAAHAQEAISVFDYDKATDDVATAELRHGHAIEDAKLEDEALLFELQTTQLDMERQNLNLSELGRQVNELKITSPVTGMIGNLLVENKDAVARNQPLLTVVDLNQFEIELQVPDSYASSLGTGMPVEISHQGRIYEGKLVAISPEVINSQITAKVQFSEGEIPDNLRQNQRVSARILLETRLDVLLVERGPFMESSGGRFTYTIEGNLAHKTPIRTGSSSISSIEIVSGLEPGNQIVISNLAEFNDADTVYLTD